MHVDRFELESKAEIGATIKLDASLAYRDPGYGAPSVAELNSPARVGKLLLDAQFFGGRLSTSGALQYMSERRHLRWRLGTRRLSSQFEF